MPTFAQACEKIRADKASSYWLKGQIQFLMDRDPVDALRDCGTLASLMQLRCAEIGVKTVNRSRKFVITDESGVVLETDWDFLMDDKGLTPEERVGIACLDPDAEIKIGGGAAPLLTVRRLA